MNPAFPTTFAVAAGFVAVALFFVLRRRTRRRPDRQPRPQPNGRPRQQTRPPTVRPPVTDPPLEEGWQSVEEETRGRVTEKGSAAGELPDAACLEAQFQQVGDASGPSGRRRGITLLGIRLDGLETVSRRYGENAGQRALLQAAEAVRRSLRERDICARWEENRFLALLPGIDRVRVPLVIHRVQRAVSALTLVTSAGNEVHLGASVGCASRPEDGASLEELLSAVRRELERVQAVPPEGVDVKPAERLRRAVPLISN